MPSLMDLLLLGMLGTSHLDLRSDPRLPVNGTKNWQLLPQRAGKIFSPRHSHATTVFKCPDNPTTRCVWLTGGYSESHRSFDLRMENENCDVWYSKDGEEWNRVVLYGDFIQGIGNWDAKPGGFAAPWYARYGHSLDALDTDGDGIADVMILAGGSSPIPSNDVWLTTDGSHWFFDGYADWPKRAYHSTAVFQGKIFILGGTPLSNDVWAGSFVKNSTREVGYTIKWSQMKDAPWTPRTGACSVVHSFDDTDGPSLSNRTEALTNTTEALFLLGGLAGYSEEHPDYEGIRSRNDVWRTTDGDSWERVTTDSKVPARAFFGCTSYNDKTSKSKLFIAGGGYMGTYENSQVRSLETYTDTWWSYNGTEWFKVNYEEGSKYQDNLYSTNEWTEITVEGGRKVYRGKWGFSLEPFFWKINTEPAPMKACSGANETLCKTVLVTEQEIPALILIGGKVEGFSMVSDTFISKQGLICERHGKTCGDHGTCGIAGCICSSNFTGDYCLDEKGNAQASAAPKALACKAPIIIAMGLLAFCREW
ncbi:hypothetical protein ACHAXM_011186 [Skeletonema potamos]